MKDRPSFKPLPPEEARLSIVIPAYNSESWIGPTLEHLWSSLRNTKWRGIEIIVFNDGSSDKTAEAAAATKIGLPVEVVTQPNLGRLKTRRKAINKASGDYVFMLDSRVYTKAGSFEYLVRQMAKNPNAMVWNGHIDVERQGNPFARFWFAITFMAWRRYYKRPRLTHYGIRDFDYYPKGAGCFLAPRPFLLNAYSRFTTYYKNDKHANDDTSLIREIAAMSDIYISPGFAFTYNSRSTWKAFLKHTLHRGVVLMDGYFRPGTRYFLPIIVYLIAVPAVIILIVLVPSALLLIFPLLASAFAGPKLLGVSSEDAAAFTYILPIFSIYYTLGLYKGLFLKLANR